MKCLDLTLNYPLKAKMFKEVAYKGFPRAIYIRGWNCCESNIPELFIADIYYDIENSSSVDTYFTIHPKNFKVEELDKVNFGLYDFIIDDRFEEHGFLTWLFKEGIVKAPKGYLNYYNYKVPVCSSSKELREFINEITTPTK